MPSKKSDKKVIKKAKIAQRNRDTKTKTLGRQIQFRIDRTQNYKNEVQLGEHPRKRARPKKVKSGPTPKRPKGLGSNKKRNSYGVSRD